MKHRLLCLLNIILIIVAQPLIILIIALQTLPYGGWDDFKHEVMAELALSLEGLAVMAEGVLLGKSNERP